MFSMPLSQPQMRRSADASACYFLLLFCLLQGAWQAVGAVEYDPLWGTLGVFTDAETCAGCHRASGDMDPAIAAVMRFPLQDDGADISPGHQWRHSIMGQAFSDPYFLAAV